MHLLCGECLPQYEDDIKEATHGRGAQCPICQQSVGQAVLTPKATKGEQGGGRSPVSATKCTSFDTKMGHSSKLLALIKDIEGHMHEDKR